MLKCYESRPVFEINAGSFDVCSGTNITPVASLWFRLQSVFHAITLKTPKNKVYMQTSIKYSLLVSGMHHRNSNPQLIKMINGLVLNIS